MTRKNYKAVITAAEQAWFDAEQEAREAEEASAEARNRADALASALAEEKVREGKNAVDGPDGRVYTVQKMRKTKVKGDDGTVTEVPPPHPYTLRRAPELRK